MRSRRKRISWRPVLQANDLTEGCDRGDHDDRWRRVTMDEAVSRSLAVAQVTSISGPFSALWLFNRLLSASAQKTQAYS